MSRNLSNSGSRSLRALGEVVEVRNYERDGTTDEYGDEQAAQRGASPHEGVTAVVETRDPDTNRDSGATRPLTEATIYLDADADAVANLAGGDDEPPRSRVIRSDGTEFLVKATLGQANGLVEAVAEVVQ